MGVLIVLAAILAAVVPYRAAAQQSPIVQCQVGAWSGTMPSYACDAVTRGARHLTFSGSDIEQGRGIAACARKVRPVTSQVWGDPAYATCQQIFMTNLQDARMRAFQHQVGQR